MTNYLRCPACKTILEVPNVAARSSLRCPACSHKVNVSSGPMRADPESKAPVLATNGPTQRAAGKGGEEAPSTAEGRTDRAEKRSRKPKRRRRTGSSRKLILGAAVGVVGLLLVLVVGIYALTRLPGPAEPFGQGLLVQAPPEVKPLEPAVPPAPEPAAPPEPPPPALWDVQPDPAPADGVVLPESLRMPLDLGEPLFASADGPFFLDFPDPRSQEVAPRKLYDLRTGEEAGRFAAKAPFSLGHVRLSPDGQYLAGPGRKRGVSLETWMLGADQAAAEIQAGTMIWFDFRSADELVTVSHDMHKVSVQTWGVSDGKRRINLEKPHQPGYQQGSIGTNGAISPGRKYLALASRGQLHLIDLTAGKVVGTASPAEGVCSHLWFSPDGAELIGVYFIREGNAGKSWLWVWKMADGRPALPATLLNLSQSTSDLLPGPDPETLISRSSVLGGADSKQPAQVFDRSSGAPVFDLPYYPVRWVGPGRLLVFMPVKYVSTGPVPNQKREVFVTAFDQAEYLARVGAARGAVAQRPAAKPAERTAVKTLRPEPAGWAVRADEAPPGPAAKSAAVQLEHGDVLFARQAGQVSSVFLLEQRKPVPRLSLIWARYDLQTGKPLGETVELWPWIKREDQASAPPPALGELPPTVSADGRRLVLRDPAHATWGRVDVWEADAGRVLGLLPYGGPAVEWHGWATDGRLLTVGDGKLTAWDVPSGRAVFEVTGNYGGRAALSPGRAWVVVPAVGHLDVLDTATGACLGRLDSGGVKPRAWSRLAVSPDGRRLAALKWSEKEPRALHTWDLDTGKTRDAFPLPRGLPGPLHWYGERRVLISSELVDVDLHTAVATCQWPEPPAALAEESTDGRLWCVAGVLKPTAYAQARVPEGPGVMHTGWRRTLLACPAPDPRVVEVLPGAPPADPAVVFHPGMEVALDVDCAGSARNERATTIMTDILRRDGFKIGPASGWKIVIKAEQYDVRMQLAPDEVATSVPGVRGRVSLLAPDGTVVGGGEIKHDLASTKSKYERRPLRDDPPGARRYDFGLRNPRAALAEEYWDAWMTSLDRPQWPRALMCFQGRYEPLPALVPLNAAAPGS